MSTSFTTLLSRIFSRSHLPMKIRKELYAEIKEASWPHKRFYILVAVSTVIAAYGLLSNSAAVIIGAMLVAPLMGPIFGIALSLISGDTKLLKASMTAEFLGVILCVGIGFLIGKLPYNLGNTPEMLARTTPTMYDLAIAFASGIAGAYASIQPKINAALPGVAIAVALVPPLGTSGLLLANGQYDLALGALMLFFANLFAIQLAAAGIFAIYEMGAVHKAGSATFRDGCLAFLPSAIAVSIIGFFMFNTLVRLLNERTFQKTLTSVLSREISYVTGGHLDEIISQQPTDTGYEIIATALTPYPFEPANVEKIQDALREEVRPDLYLIIRSLQSKDASAKGQVFLSPEDLEIRLEGELNAQILATARRTIEREIRIIGGARMENLYRSADSAGLRFTAVISTPKVIPPEIVSAIESSLQTDIGQPARLIIRSIIARDADKDHYIYEALPDKAKELPPEEARLRANIRVIMTSALSAYAGATLLDILFVESDAVLEITAVVETPYPITPEQTAEIETVLKGEIGRELKLAVNSVMGGTATAEGWQTYLEKNTESPAAALEP